jgi:prepilin-type N-terminal cleavage/methylation domain-containing protein
MFKIINTIKSQKGLSLIEMLIAMVVILIGVLSSYALLASVHGTRAGNVAATQAQQEARNIVEQITRELRESAPNVVWVHHSETNYISFFTPRNAAKQFIVDPEGKPNWQRAIGYALNQNSNTIYRYQLYLTHDPDIFYDSFYYESISKNAEELSFSRVNDMLTISVRTFYDHTGKNGNVTRSYADLSTTIKLRN